MRKYLSLLLITLSLMLAACDKKDKPEDEKVIEIGAILPLTGDYAKYGNYMKQGMEIALEDAIKMGKVNQNKIRIIFEDSQANPQKSVTAIKKLIDIDNVIACIPATSGVILAIKSIINKSRIITLNATAISPEINDSNDYIFSIIPDAILEGKYLAEIGINKLGKRKAAIIYRNDQSGISFYNTISKYFIELGGTVVYHDAHQPNSIDFGSILAEIATKKSIDIIYVMSFGPEVAQFAKQAKEKGQNIQIVTYETFNSPNSIEIAGDAANGIIFCSPIFDKNSNKKEIVDIKRRIKEKYNQVEFNFFIAAHYDALMILIESISNGAKNGEEIKEYLNRMSSYSGITGNIKFDKNGACIVPLQLFKVENKNFIIIK